MQVATQDDAEKVVEVVKAAFPSWKETSTTIRGLGMIKFAELLEANVENIAISSQLRRDSLFFSQRK